MIWVPSVLWRCWLGGRKRIRPVKNWEVGCWHGYQSGARCRLAYAQRMSLPLTVSCFSKILIGFTFLVPAHLGSPGKGPLNECSIWYKVMPIDLVMPELRLEQSVTVGEVSDAAFARHVFTRLVAALRPRRRAKPVRVVVNSTALQLYSVHTHACYYKLIRITAVKAGHSERMKKHVRKR